MPQQTATALKKSYDETLALMVEARNYLAYRVPHEVRVLPDKANLTASCELFRLTSRLIQVMAWLMAQRAVHAGEMDVEEACSERFRLSGGSACLDDSVANDDSLPNGLLSLLERSLKLYERISRLDAMAAHRSTLGRLT